MTRDEFKKLCESKIVFLDGATGSNLQKKGMPAGVCPEKWILENPNAIIELQQDYVKAGSNIVYAPTFTANKIKLEEYGLYDQIEKINHDLVALSKKAVDGKAYVAGDISMTGIQLEPLGEMKFETLVDIYKEQAEYCVEAGVDLVAVETMMSLNETRAAVFAIREVCDLPIITTLTFNPDGRTLYGTDPETASIVLSSIGVDALGVNCSVGPEAMAETVKLFAKWTSLPVIAKPNAGMPALRDGKTVYDLTPEDFAKAGKLLVDAGASILGGCCGSTPEHIGELVKSVGSLPVPKHEPKSRRVLTSERKYVEIKLDGNFHVVGERINPTGKKKLQEELREGKLDMVSDFARSQEENGATILDINMGTSGIDEKAMMLAAINEVSGIVDCPLCIDSSHVDIIEAALRVYPGRALINSISGEAGRAEALLPLAKKYGAMFIALPLSEAGLPKSIEEKHEILHGIIDKALEYGLTKEDIVVDGLVATVGANPNAALECYATFAHCKDDLGLPTICGLSNVSFGMPARPFVNSAFLVTAIAKGLTMAIANPDQEMLMNLAFASDMLLNKEDAAARYLDRMNMLAERGPVAAPTAVSNTAKAPTPLTASADPMAADPVYDCVLKGKKNAIGAEIQKKLDAGEVPGDIINNYLVPAINKVGDYYDQKKYFLPQLIAGANAMQDGMKVLEPLLAKEDGAKGDVVVFATVEGDIHDIGKNLCVLMLKNYGFEVIDLGKDVPASVIVDAALENNAVAIGLSALMTTTMIKMKDVVDIAKEKGCAAKIAIGGACITDDYAKEIGADGYSEDAAGCVRLIKKLLEE
ncbi:MAG: homocysteine S-methyltransferase family protein [Lachnospiraceae bacterium]|nr:homocysteine S-methyltransferase family protein [Lachnospiraceae bacterium]